MMLTLLAIIAIVVVANALVLAALAVQYRHEAAQRQPKPVRVLTPAG